ncbi:MAG: class I SAM-dependent methyltransferase [Proteobacteria bacterium]|nr:class I SAM-dependent methyltransferase [Pseudomonadota bacterium]
MESKATRDVKAGLKRLVAEPRARGFDLESAEATAAHARIIRDKPFLRKLYERYYGEFARADRGAPAGARVEIGSGGGFLDRVVPGLVRLDVRPGAEVDLVASALALPFAARTVGAAFMLNVLHHLPDVSAFFSELERVLAPGGRAVMIEPYASPISGIVYRLAHHEPFDPDQADWPFAGSGAMTAANGALPWIVFERDRARFESEHPRLEIVRIAPHTISLYALSGGLSYRSLAPGFSFSAIAAAEDLLCRVPLARALASMMTIELRNGG